MASLKVQVVMLVFILGCRDVLDAVSSFVAQGQVSLVLNLRGRGGIFVSQSFASIRFAGEFVRASNQGEYIEKHCVSLASSVLAASSLLMHLRLVKRTALSFREVVRFGSQQSVNADRKLRTGSVSVVSVYRSFSFG
jgi:hypothetical protein